MFIERLRPDSGIFRLQRLQQDGVRRDKVGRPTAFERWVCIDKGCEQRCREDETQASRNHICRAFQHAPDTFFFTQMQSFRANGTKDFNTLRSAMSVAKPSDKYSVCQVPPQPVSVTPERPTHMPHSPTSAPPNARCSRRSMAKSMTGTMLAGERWQPFHPACCVRWNGQGCSSRPVRYATASMCTTSSRRRFGAAP